MKNWVKKKGSALLLALVMVFTMLPVTASAASDTIYVALNTDLSTLQASIEDAVADNEYVIVIFQESGSYTISSTLRVSGDVTFTAPEGEDVALLWGGGEFGRHIIVEGGNRSTISVNNLTFDGASEGGGIEANCYRVSLTDVTMKNCVTDGNGGALSVSDPTILISGGYCEITNSTFVNNQAENGGGIFAMVNLSLAETTITQNTATGNYGGGIYAWNLTYRGGTLSQNIVEGDAADDTVRPQGAGAYALKYANLTSLDGNYSESKLTVSGNTFKNKAGLGGGIYAPQVTVNSVYGGLNREDALFENNGVGSAEYAGAYAGGAIYSACSQYNSSESITLEVGDATFRGNYASQMGGAIASFENYVRINNSHFEGNITEANSALYSGGGAIYSSFDLNEDNNLSTGYNPIPRSTPAATYKMHVIAQSTFDSNVSDRGGAIYLDHTAEAQYYGRNNVLISASRFEDNIANQDGGGIYLSNDSQTMLYIGAETRLDMSSQYYSYEDSEVIFTGNEAGVDGGAIWIDPARPWENLQRLYVGEETSFGSGVSGQTQLVTEASDIAMHKTYVKASVFTNSMGYGYNNDDIAYWTNQSATVPKVVYLPGCGGQGDAYIDSTPTSGTDTVPILGLSKTGISAQSNQYRFVGWMEISVYDAFLEYIYPYYKLYPDNFTMFYEYKMLYPGSSLTLQGETVYLVGVWEPLYTVEYYVEKSSQTGEYDLVYTDPVQYGVYDRLYLWDGGNDVDVTVWYDEHFRYYGSGNTYPAGAKVNVYDLDYNKDNVIEFYMLYEDPMPSPPDTYTVTYIKSLGSDEKVDGGTYIKGTDYYPERYEDVFGNVPEGYVFEGWTEDPEDDNAKIYDLNEYIYISGVTSNIVLYPVFASLEEHYEDYGYILYLPNGGTAHYGNYVDTNDYRGYTVGDTATAFFNEFDTGAVKVSWYVRDGYKFTGWNTAADGNGIAYAVGDPFEVEATLMIFYAQWEETKEKETPPGPGTPSTYSIIYNANEGTGTVKDANSPYQSGAKATVLDSGDMAKEGFKFTGWNTTADGTGTSYSAGDAITMTKNVTLYAQWKVDDGTGYTVTYDPNGGTGDLKDDNTYNSGDTVKVLSPGSSIKKSGSGFSSWNTKADGTGTTYHHGSTFVITEDTTLYAIWRKFSNPTGEDIILEDPIPPLGEWPLNLDDHFAYIIGYTDGTVSPDGKITRDETVTIFFRLLDPDTRDEILKTKNSFADVAETRWSNTAISTLASVELVKGYTDGTFAPAAYITRGEFAAIASRFDTTEIEQTIVFSDTAGHWAQDEISRAASLGWIRGYTDGSFRPDEYITRAEVATFVNRMLLRLVQDESGLCEGMIQWPDNADPAAWYYLDIQEATNSHYYERIEGTLYEQWTELRENFDWTVYEKSATANTVASKTIGNDGAAKLSLLVSKETKDIQTGSIRRLSNGYTRVETTVKPTIDTVYYVYQDNFGFSNIYHYYYRTTAYSGVISGTGIPGAAITLILPEGETRSGTVAADGTWSFAVDANYVNTHLGNVIGAVQQEAGKKESVMATENLSSQSESIVNVVPIAVSQYDYSIESDLHLIYFDCNGTYFVEEKAEGDVKTFYMSGNASATPPYEGYTFVPGQYIGAINVQGLM